MCRFAEKIFPLIKLYLQNMQHLKRISDQFSREYLTSKNYLKGDLHALLKTFFFQMNKQKPIFDYMIPINNFFFKLHLSMPEL